MRNNHRAGWWSVVPLLTATLTTTMANTVVNVPMSTLLEELHAPLSRGVLVSTAFTVTLAALMPLSGWLGDRLGHRRVFCAAMALMVFGAVGAALAGNLAQLVAFRAVQGLAAAPVLPAVMVLVVRVLGPERRSRALGLWAAANGAGQALGPTTGGVLADLLGWRAVFWQVVPLSVLVVFGGLALLPADPERRRATTELERQAPGFDWRGAGLLTVGSALLLAATSSVPTLGGASPLVWAGVAAGLTTLLVFGVVERGRPGAFLRPRQLLEVRYLRSAAAVAVQMFAMGATLLAAPAYLVGVQGESTSRAGIAVLTLPLAMAVLAPVAGWAAERVGGRTVMRSGLLVLLLAQALLGTLTALHGGLLPLVGVLLLVGAGIAGVQTPAATGASRSEAGRTGAGLGLFNLVRFGSTALGTACVALLGSQPAELAGVFGVSAGLLACGLCVSFLGGDPSEPPAAPGAATREASVRHPESARTR